MEQRLANTWRMTLNEKKFIETALLSNLRVDGRAPFDYRKLTIKFGSEGGSAEVQLGHTRVMGVVTAQLVQPYRDRPNEGSLAIYTEFSPMADPLFEPGRPGEWAVELGRIIDRGLRESRAVDTESLCVLSGKSVWAIRIDLHILDNGGNLVDAANIAALAALKTFRRPDCTLGGEDGQHVIIQPPEVREPLPLIIHHLPIAVTFAYFSNESTLVIDPTHFEEAVMGGRMSATLNTNGDICAIQKGGGEGVLKSVIMQCLRIAKLKAEEITKIINTAVESYETERTLRKVKRHSASIAVDVGETVSQHQKGSPDLSISHMERLKLTSEQIYTTQSRNVGNDDETTECDMNRTNKSDGSRTFCGGPSSWDPCSEGVDSDFLKASLASHAVMTSNKKQKESIVVKKHPESMSQELQDDKNNNTVTSSIAASQSRLEKHGEKTLKDAVKPKSKRKQKSSSSNAAN